ncbi:MAG: hypothetical protein II925_00885, partial [Methanomicrobium sp.]|nr:hypothetical protein [Methanomicrobium sp.]
SLIFSFPAVINHNPLEDFPECESGSDGCIAGIIERIKSKVHDTPELRLLGGLDTAVPKNYGANIEPVTFCHVSYGTGSDLWKADEKNCLSGGKVLLNLSGALPYPEVSTDTPDSFAIRRLNETFAALLDAVAKEVVSYDGKSAEKNALCSADQKRIRAALDSMGLVSFIADGTMPVRSYTKYRTYFRVAGPALYAVRKGNSVTYEHGSVPYECPSELTPVEMELPASGGVVTGLGIRKKEVFAVIGSNAEGKSTFLQTIRSGCDDHLPGDGREYTITSGNVMSAESSEADITGADIRLFFRSLPKGTSGTPANVTGKGSGSMGMAAQFTAALRRRASLIIIDEDKSATNLLVPNCIQSSDVTPLSVICRKERHKLGDSSILFAAATMDILTAEADRILKFSDHRMYAVGRDEFRVKLKEYLRNAADEL